MTDETDNTESPYKDAARKVYKDKFHGETAGEKAQGEAGRRQIQEVIGQTQQRAAELNQQA